MPVYKSVRHYFISPPGGGGAWSLVDTDSRAPRTDIEKYEFAMLLVDSGNQTAIKRGHELLGRLSGDRGDSSVFRTHQYFAALKKSLAENDKGFTSRWEARKLELRSMPTNTSKNCQ